MTKSFFRKQAFSQPVSLLGIPLSVDPVQFRTGSSGWRTKCALYVKVGDEHVKVLCNVTMTAVKSKEWKA